MLNARRIKAYSFGWNEAKWNRASPVGAAYPEAYIPRRSLVRIIPEVAALAAYAKPNEPLQRTRTRVCSRRPVSVGVCPIDVLNP